MTLIRWYFTFFSSPLKENGRKIDLFLSSLRSLLSLHSNYAMTGKGKYKSKWDAFDLRFRKEHFRTFLKEFKGERIMVKWREWFQEDSNENVYVLSICSMYYECSVVHESKYFSPRNVKVLKMFWKCKMYTFQVAGHFHVIECFSNMEYIKFYVYFVCSWLHSILWVRSSVDSTVSSSAFRLRRKYIPDRIH